MNRSTAVILTKIETAMEDLEDAAVILRSLDKDDSVPPVCPVSPEDPWFKCGNCGTDIDDHFKYCPYCGRKVKWDGMG